MRFPNFLIIGAMKAGTTTLHQDLSLHPNIFMPDHKEPQTLAKYSDLERISADYTSLFGYAKPDQLLGEASTDYTKLPDFSGVASRAREVCGRQLKCIYLTRDPVERAISHYKHDFGLGYVTEPIEVAVRKYSRYVNYSLFDMQLAPWRDAFGSDSILTISFERYVAERNVTARRVVNFLGLDADALPLLDAERVYNASDGKLAVRQGPLRDFVRSRYYQRVVKRALPRWARDKLKLNFASIAPAPNLDQIDEARNYLNSIFMHSNKMGKHGIWHQAG